MSPRARFSVDCDLGIWGLGLIFHARHSEAGLVLGCFTLVVFWGPR